MKYIILLGLYCSAVCGAFAQAQDTLLPVKSHGQWGFINRSGKVVIPLEYDGVDPFQAGSLFTKAVKNHKVLVISRTNAVIAETEFENLHVLNDSLLIILSHGKWGLYTINNVNILPPVYKRIRITDRSYLILRTDTGCGISDLQGKIIIPIRYDSITRTPTGFVVIKNGLQGVYTSTGHKVLDTYCANVYRGAAACYFYLHNGLWGAVDDSGKSILEDEWNSLTGISNAFIKLQKDDHVYLYSTVLRKIIDSASDDYSWLGSRYVLTTFQGMYGLINERGKVIAKPVYKKIEPLDVFSFKVQTDNGIGIVDTNGNIIGRPQYDNIMPFAGPLALVQIADWWGGINRRGVEVIPVKYDYLELFRNSVKAYMDGKLRVFEFDDNGNLTQNNAYNNVIHIAVNYRINPEKGYSSSSGSSAANTPLASTPLTKYRAPILNWFCDSSTKLYGLMKDSCDIRIPAIYSGYNSLEDHITIVKKSRSPVNYSIGHQVYTFRYTYGLVNDSTGKRMTAMDYVFIDDEPMKKPGWKFTRAMLADGSFVIIYHNGLVSRIKYGFIDALQGGLVRFCTKAELVARSKSDRGGCIMTVDDFVTSLKLGAPVYSLYDSWRSYERFYLYAENAKWGYLDADGNIAIAADYDFASRYFLGTAIVNRGDKWGVLDTLGRDIVPLEYRYVQRLEGSSGRLFLLTSFEPKYGVIDSKGNIIAQLMYDRVGTFHEGAAVCIRNKHYGFIDSSFHQLNDTAFRQARDLSEGLAAIRFNGQRWGYINSSASVIIPPAFPQAGDFHNGLAYAVSKGKYGYINTSGQWQIQPQYYRATDFNRYGLAIVKNRTNYALIDKDNKTRLSGFDRISPYLEGIAIGQKGKKFMLIDSNGQRYRTLHHYRAVHDFHDGYARVQHKNAFGFIDKNGKVVKKPVLPFCSDISEGISIVGHDRKKQIFSIVDTVLQRDMQQNIISSFSEGLAIVKESDTVYYYIDRYGKNALGKHFTNAFPFQNGLARVQIGKLWGAIDHNGIMVISPKFDDIGDFSEGKASVRMSSFSGVADLQGNIIVPAECEYLRYEPSEKMIRLERGNQLGYLRTNGSWLWKMDE